MATEFRISKTYLIVIKVRSNRVVIFLGSDIQRECYRQRNGNDDAITSLGEEAGANRLISDCGQIKSL